MTTKKRKSSKQAEIERLTEQLEIVRTDKQELKIAFENLQLDHQECFSNIAKLNNKINQLDYDCAAKQIQLANLMNEKSNHVAIIASQADSISRLSNTILKMVERINERDGE